MTIFGYSPEEIGHLSIPQLALLTRDKEDDTGDRWAAAMAGVQRKRALLAASNT